MTSWHLKAYLENIRATLFICGDGRNGDGSAEAYDTVNKTNRPVEQFHDQHVRSMNALDKSSTLSQHSG
jgi:hypothetical protein